MQHDFIVSAAAYKEEFPEAAQRGEPLIALSAQELIAREFLRTLFFVGRHGHDPILLQRCGDVSEGVIDGLIHALLRDGVERALELETMNRFEAEVERRAA